ncbi:MAG: hypothetical protein JOY79_10050 [Acidobacteriaceae bacterium]|nr:hypothetical protein [Acidobacteriaceae bacterium]
MLFSASERGRSARLYVQDVQGGDPKPITPEGTTTVGFALSPDGQLVAAVGPDGKGYFYPVTGGDPHPIPGLAPEEIPIL